MRKMIFVALLVILAGSAWTQKFFVNGGVTQNAISHTTSTAAMTDRGPWQRATSASWLLTGFIPASQYMPPLAGL